MMTLNQFGEVGQLSYFKLVQEYVKGPQIQNSGSNEKFQIQEVIKMYPLAF